MKDLMELPDGSTTRNRRVFLRDWGRYIKRISKALNIRVTAFGSGEVCITDNVTCERATVPRWLIERMGSKTESI